MGTFNKSAAASQDFLQCMPRKECTEEGLLIAHFDGLTEDQVRSTISALNPAIKIDLVVMEEGMLLFQVPTEEEESLRQRVMELPCFISCDAPPK